MYKRISLNRGPSRLCPMGGGGAIQRSDLAGEVTNPRLSRALDLASTCSAWDVTAW
jgi:hypothetical protein